MHTYINNRVKLGVSNNKPASYINSMTFSDEIKLGTSKALPFIPLLNSVNDAKVAFTGLDLYNYAKDESEIQDAKLFTFMNLVSLGIASSIGSGAREGKSVTEVVGEGEKKITSMSNEELVQEIATRAEKHVGGTGSVAGTQKHTYSKRLLDRYQSMFGDRGLRTETSWVNGKIKPYGTKGSVRIDVLDIANKTAYDYKFTIYPGQGLKQSQINKILDNTSVKYVKEVNP